MQQLSLLIGDERSAREELRSWLAGRSFHRMARRQLWAPAQVMQQSPDMINVVVHGKPTLHQFGHPWTSPQVSVKASGLRPFEQQRFQPTFVSSREFRRSSWRGPRCSLQ